MHAFLCGDDTSLKRFLLIPFEDIILFLPFFRMLIEFHSGKL